MFVPRVLAIGAQRTLKERHLIINNFNKGISLRDTAEIMQRTYSTVQHILRGTKRKTGLLTKSGTAPRIFLQHTTNKF